MADGGDGAIGTSSEKETRNMLSDGPVTDPASGTKVSRASSRYCSKNQTVLAYSVLNVRANVAVVCHGCHICRRSYDGVVERNEAPYKSIVVSKC